MGVLSTYRMALLQKHSSGSHRPRHTAMRFPLLQRLAVLLLCATPVLCKAPVINHECALKCIKKDGWNQMCVDDGRADMRGTIYPNDCAWQKCVATTADRESTPRYHLAPLECFSPTTCVLRYKNIVRCKQVWLDGRNTTAPSPRVDRACACARPTELSRCKPGRRGCPLCLNDLQCGRCDNGFYRKRGACKPCPANCKKCSIRDPKYCGICNEGFAWFPRNGTCMRR